MTTFKLDDVEYNLENLSDNGKAQFASLQFLEAQMGQLTSKIAVYQTARNAYAQALKEELNEI